MGLWLTKDKSLSAGRHAEALDCPISHVKVNSARPCNGVAALRASERSCVNLLQEQASRVRDIFRCRHGVPFLGELETVGHREVRNRAAVTMAAHISILLAASFLHSP